MKIWFEGKIDSLKKGIELFAKELKFEIASGGIYVQVEQRPGNIEVALENGKGIIRYGEKIHFFRALGLLCEEVRHNMTFKIEEEPQFEMNGIMADVSRNAVLKVDGIKMLLTKMAVMGLNMMMLYSEDTYTVPGRPYFGYMRGRYSYEELKECDDYADMLGIEMVPCIQTLAHLEQALKWNYANGIKDTSDILLAGNEETYKFVEDMIKAASAPFRSKRIHLGMDEAMNLGLGRYLELMGYQRRFDIMNAHLNRVREITDKYGLEPMIWSDMYFRLGSKIGDYYDKDAVIPEDIVEKIPENLGLVYWDYYHNDEDDYLNFIRKHKDFRREVIFAGGIWTWNGLTVNYSKTFVTTNSGLNACKKEGVRKVFATMWGDNGAETNIFSALLGLQLYAEHGYAKEVDEEKLRKRFEFCTGGSYDAFMELTNINQIPGTAEKSSDIANPEKYLLWQDVLIGLFDKHVEGFDLESYYSKLAEKIEVYINENSELGFVFEMPYKLCTVLSQKAAIGIEIKNYYDSGNMEALKEAAQGKLVKLYNDINELRIAHRKQWFKSYKPFGWEIIDIRYGGLLARVNTAITRIMEYINGEVDTIEELDAERLYFDVYDMPHGQGFGNSNQYHRIISASPIG